MKLKNIFSRKAKIEYRELGNPFKDLSEEKRAEIASQIGKKASQEYQESFKKLENSLLKTAPLIFLSSISLYMLFEQNQLMLGQKKTVKRKKELPLMQHHIEILQALILQHKSEEFSLDLLHISSQVDDIKKHVESVDLAFSLKRMKGKEGISSKEKQRNCLVEFIRSQTKGVRNWGYFDQVMDIVTKLFSPIDDDIERSLGIKITHFVKMISSLANLIEDRIDIFRKNMAYVLKAKTIDEMVERYYDKIPNLRHSSKELKDLFRKRRLNKKQARSLLIGHTTLRNDDVFKFSVSDFISCYPERIDKDIIEKVLEAISLKLGDLASYKTEHIFLDNPIWSKPFIKNEKGSYSCPIFGLLQSFIIEIIENILKLDQAIFKKYESRRSDFLEEEISYQMKQAFPFAHILRQVVWKDPISNKEYENDILAVVDSCLVLIEAKSGKVPDSAKRGGDKRLEHIIDGLIVEPSKQSKRLEKFLLSSRRTIKLITKKGEKYNLNTNKIKYCIRLNITLDSLGDLQANCSALQEAGFIDKNVEVAPTMTLADLGLVFDLLEKTSEKLHYLVRRTAFERNAKFTADEIDLLSFYLDTGFNIGEAEFDGTHMMLTGMSETFLDPYYITRKYDKKVLKPKCKRTKWYSDILDRMEATIRYRYTEATHILLNFAYADQIKCENGIKRMQIVMKFPWIKPSHAKIVQILAGPKQRRNIIVAIILKGASLESIRGWMDRLTREAINKYSMDSALVLVKDIIRRDYPYVTMGYFKK